MYMQARGLSNVTVITADINAFEAPSKDFDRVISIEVRHENRHETHAWFFGVSIRVPYCDTINAEHTA